MDERTQTLLRRWQETDDRDAQEAYLRWRLRAQSISWTRIETAAYLGDPVSKRLLGEDALAFVPGQGVSQWLTRLPCQTAPLVRRQALLAGLASSREALPPPVEIAVQAARREDIALLQEVYAKAPPAETSLFNADDWLIASVSTLAREWLDPDVGSADGFYSWAIAQGFLGDEASVRRVRGAIAAALLPRILVEPCPDPVGEDRYTLDRRYPEAEAFDPLLQAERAARLADDGEQLFVLGVMEPAHAQAVLEAVSDPSKKKPSVADAAAALEAYGEARGWRKVRTSRVAPSGTKRVKIKKRSINFEFRNEGKWEKKIAHRGRETLLTHAGQWLLDAARLAAKR